MTPEQEARTEIDRLLAAAGWSVQARDQVNLGAAQGVAVCEYPLKKGHGFADYLLYVDGAAVGVVEAKKAGIPLTAVEIQTDKYSQGLPDHIPAPRRPLPFCYQSTGIETRFTNLLEPDARSRPVFAFHRPETLSHWIQADLKSPGSTARRKLRTLPPLDARSLWPAQRKAIAGSNNPSPPIVRVLSFRWLLAAARLSQPAISSIALSSRQRHPAKPWAFSIRTSCKPLGLE